MNQLSRIIEPPTTRQQVQALQQYKKYMWSGISPYLSCMNVLPSSIIDSQWEWLQVIDLWWDNWSFCKIIKNWLPKAEVICVDISLVWNTSTNWVNMVWDDLLHVERYINSNREYTLLVCIDTIHHLDEPELFFDIVKKLPSNIGLYIKDYIRPMSEEQLIYKMDMLNECITIICRQDKITADIVINLSKQSLLASLWQNEIHVLISDISWIDYKETNNGITYEISRNVNKK